MTIKSATFLTNSEADGGRQQATGLGSPKLSQIDRFSDTTPYRYSTMYEVHTLQLQRTSALAGHGALCVFRNTSDYPDSLVLYCINRIL